MNATPLPPGKYKTRDGRDAEVLAHVGTPAQPRLLGFVENPDHNKDGRIWYVAGNVMSSGKEHAGDLLAPTKRRPYEPGEIPVGALIRNPAEFGEHLVLSRRINVVLFFEGSMLATYTAEDLFRAGWEVSHDHGNTWSFFGKEEGQ